MKESEIENRVMLYANTKGVTQYKFVSPNTRGVPDRILLFEGRCMFIEFKQRGGTTSRLQDLQIKRIRAAGIQVEVADSVTSGVLCVDRFVYNMKKV